MSKISTFFGVLFWILYAIGSIVMGAILLAGATKWGVEAVTKRNTPDPDEEEDE